MNAMELPLRPLTAANFAPYGEVLELAGEGGRAINAGTSARRDLPSALDFQQAGGRPQLAIFEAQAQAAAGPWRMLERHRLGSQSFVPLAAGDWLLLVALGEAGPRRDTLAAFRATAQQGATLHAGTWHHPLVALAPARFLVLERAGDAVDCELAELLPPVRIAA